MIATMRMESRLAMAPQISSKVSGEPLRRRKISFLQTERELGLICYLAVLVGDKVLLLDPLLLLRGSELSTHSEPGILQ